MTKDVEHLRAYFSFESPLLRILCLAFYLLFNWFIWPFWSLTFWVFIYFEYYPSLNVGLVKLFSQTVACWFVILTLSFAVQRFVFLELPYINSIFDLSAWAIGILFKKFPLCQYVGVHFLLSLLLDSMYLVLCWWPWLTWSWPLCRVISVGPYTGPRKMA